MGPMGPQGPQEGTGSLPGGSPGQGEHGEEVRGDFWKTRFLGPRRPPSNPEKLPQNRLPSLRDLSQSLRAAFLVQVDATNASGASTATHFGSRAIFLGFIFLGFLFFLGVSVSFLVFLGVFGAPEAPGGLGGASHGLTNPVDSISRLQATSGWLIVF